PIKFCSAIFNISVSLFKYTSGAKVFLWLLSNFNCFFRYVGSLFKGGMSFRVVAGLNNFCGSIIVDFKFYTMNVCKIRLKKKMKLSLKLSTKKQNPHKHWCYEGFLWSRRESNSRPNK